MFTQAQLATASTWLTAAVVVVAMVALVSDLPGRGNDAGPALSALILDVDGGCPSDSAPAERESKEESFEEDDERVSESAARGLPLYSPLAGTLPDSDQSWCPGDWTEDVYRPPDSRAA